MNTSKKYLTEIEYKQAKCCFNCTYFIQTVEIKYCSFHDNPVSPTAVCKNFNVKVGSQQYDK